MTDAKMIVRQPGGWLKSHGLGNDYIVLNSRTLGFELVKEDVIRICDTHYGIGSDGILLKEDSDRANFGLKIYNPDGSMAEKSGNGLRIFADYLYSMDFTDELSFSIEVGGAVVKCDIGIGTNNERDSIAVDIGGASFIPKQVPVICDKDEALDIELILDGDNYMFSAVSVGNPHAVCIVEDVTKVDVCGLGPLVENHEIFPNRTNVQFAQVLDRDNVQIEIWERGAGYTLASGTSSCGVVSVLYKKGLVGNHVKVHMPGGVLEVDIDEEFNLRLTGPVKKTACGVLL